MKFNIQASTRNDLIMILAAVVLLMVPGTTLAALPTWGTSARGMAGAYVVGTNNLSGISYNPAISSTVTNRQFVSDLSSRQFGSNLSVENGTLGILERYNSTTHSITINRERLNFDFGNFSFKPTGLSLTVNNTIGTYNLGYSPYESLHTGLSLNALVISSSVSDGQASGWGADAGLLYFPTYNLSLGGSVRSLAGYRKWSTGTKEPLSYSARTGIRYSLARTLQVETDTVYDERFGLTSINAGLEWWVYSAIKRKRNTFSGRKSISYYRRRPYETYDQAFALRFGIKQDKTSGGEIHPAFGITTIVNTMTIHYSFNNQRQGETAHSFGFQYKLQ
ncbi:MAG: hypothetical protein ABEK50_06230 [bacterium]